MPVTTMPVVAPGDTITSAGWNTLIDNINVIDARTGGDPGAANKIEVSSSGTAGGWLAPGTEGYPLQIASGAPGYYQLTSAGLANDSVTAAQIAADAVGASEIAAGAVGTSELADDGVTAAKIAADAVGSSEIAAGAVGSSELGSTAIHDKLGYTPVNPASAAITEDMTVSRSSAPTTGFIGLGNSLAHYIGGDGSQVVTDTGKVWTDGNDGPASGLAAQTAATATSATTAAACSGNAATATSATDSLALGGALAALYAKLASPALTGTPTRNAQTIPMYKVGSYAGAGGSGNQLAMGFLPTFAIIYGTNGTAGVVHVIRSASASQNVKVANTFGLGAVMSADTATRIHASDGLVIDTGDGSDTSGYTYYWVAMG